MRKGFETVGYRSKFMRQRNFITHHLDDRRGRNILCGCSPGIRLGSRYFHPRIAKGMYSYKLKGRRR